MTAEPRRRANRLNRRRFLTESARRLGAVGGLGAAGALPAIGAMVGAGVWSERPARASRDVNERLNVAAIGVGNRGAVNLAAVKSERIVALCDVDRRMLEPQRAAFPDAAVYRDFRPLLERSDLDAVVISTPDHTHYHAARMALERGLHVYCEKPLAHSVWEVRQLAQAAARAGVATQLGNQHHGSEGYRRVADWVRSGVLGEIREVHSWTSRPLWPQGVGLPAGGEPVPDGLDWDLWLGPAPARPYASGYHPFAWRGWWDFGGGALADMGPHLLDPVVTALELAAPSQIRARSSEVNDQTLPSWSVVEFDFPARAERAALRVTWYDGGQQPPREVTGVEDLHGNGTFLIGSEARLFIPQLGGRPLAVPYPGKPRPARPKFRDEPSPGHHAEWLRACKGGPATSSDFQYAARLTEICLLGNIAIRTGQPLRWDAARMRFPGQPEADRYLRRTYREGW